MRLISDLFTDASLAAHEYEVKRLESIVASRQIALSLVKKHMELIAEKQHLEESSKDPSRLTQRGAQAAGRLLQEEKVRKKLGKELPKVCLAMDCLLTGKLEQDLVSVLRAWEDENGEDFLVYGERYLNVVDRLARPEKTAPPRNVRVRGCKANASSEWIERLLQPRRNQPNRQEPLRKHLQAGHLLSLALFLLFVTSQES
jgi:Ase1/PRC1/MAP65 family protein